MGYSLALPDEIMAFPVGKGHAGFGRVPVVVRTCPPARRPERDLPGGRRPVVAVLDTVADPVLGVHPWLAPTDGEAFLVEADWAPTGDDAPKHRTGGVPLDKAAGHGTFIAGLIRQAAPDARVLMLRVMQADGTVRDHHLREALCYLLERVQAESPDGFVDVICLALGYYEKNARDMKFTAKLRHILGELGNLGVRVVASAGNNPDSLYRVYPAALATAGNKPKTPLISVGSYDPDGRTPSIYSRGLDWVTNWEIGTAVVSTMPAFPGSGRTAYGGPAPYDPDDYTCRFARWSGTSFAAGYAAGRLAQALVTPALGDPALDPHQRARAALAVLSPVNPG
ncbi:MAG TPA: S8/S53 family peptidase [Actinomycetes bacterium]|nr:S8/S53 family peptidase [Actinomycetes bacterium]